MYWQLVLFTKMYCIRVLLVKDIVVSKAKFAAQISNLQ